MEQLEAYTSNLVRYYMIEDFSDDLACAYFLEKIPVTLSYAQASVFLCLGLQGKDISRIEKEMKLEKQQIMSLYLKVMKKFYKYLSGIASKDSFSTVRLKEIAMEPHPISVDDDLNEAAKQDNMKSKLDGSLNPDILQQYAIVGGEADFENALQKSSGKVGGEADFENALQKSSGKVLSGGVISIKSDRKKAEKQGMQIDNQKSEKKRSKHDHSSRSNKRRS